MGLFFFCVSTNNIAVWLFCVSTKNIAVWVFCVWQVLDVIAPPYTPEFVQLFLPLIENNDITGILRAEDGSDPVSEFLSRLFLSWFPFFLLL